MNHYKLLGGNVLREAIDLLQLEKIEHLKAKNDKAENKILDLEKEVKKLKQDHETEMQKTVQRNTIQMKTLQNDVKTLDKHYKKTLNLSASW